MYHVAGFEDLLNAALTVALESFNNSSAVVKRAYTCSPNWTESDPEDAGTR